MRRRPYHAVVQRQTKPLARRQVGVHNIGVQTVLFPQAGRQRVCMGSKVIPRADRKQSSR